MDQTALALISAKELTLLNKVLDSRKVDQFIEKLQRLEEQGDTTVVQAIKQYTRSLVVLLLLNKRNKDSTLNKLKFSNSFSLLFAIKPLIKKLLDRCAIEGKWNRDVIANFITLFISFVKYPSALKYQRNYLSIYLTITSLELILDEFTKLRAYYWLLFPLTFAKTWEYYNLHADHTPTIGLKLLDFCSKDISMQNLPAKLLEKSRIGLALLPVFTLLNYKKHKTLTSLKPLAQTLKLTAVTLLVTTSAKLITAGDVIGLSNKRLRLQLIGLISSLPTVVYLQNSGLWLYLTRVMMISINRKHSLVENSKLNRFKVDKILIIGALFVILDFKDRGKLDRKRLLDRLAGYINRGNMLT